MNRRIAGATTVILLLGMTACSGSPSEPATSAPEAAAPTTTAAAPTSAPAETADSEQSVIQACSELTGPMAEASSAMSQIANAGTSDPQAAVDSWTVLANAFGEFGDSVSNAEVKTVATDLHEDITAVRDAMQKVYVEGDMGAMSEFTTATTEFQTSYTQLTELCAG